MLTEVKKFYDENCFPGNYTIEQVTGYGKPIKNRYLQLIDNHIVDGMTILDAGCGTGLIPNLLAIRNKKSNITGLDFSNAIYYAQDFANTHNITNVKFIHQDLVTYQPNKKFDVIICQGVLHHILDYQQVLNKLLDSIDYNGKMILGLYHPFGRLMKKFVAINYHSDLLYRDQELNPYVITFTYKQLPAIAPGWEIKEYVPKFLNSVGAAAFFNYRNGGLVTYVLERKT